MKYPVFGVFLVSFLFAIHSSSVFAGQKKADTGGLKLPEVSSRRPMVTQAVTRPVTRVTLVTPSQSDSESDFEGKEGKDDRVKVNSPLNQVMVTSVPGPDELISETASSSILDQLISSIQMSVSQFRAFLNLLPSAVVVANRTGKIAIVNDAATRFFGYSIREMEGFLGATTLKDYEVRGMSVTALMPPEIGFVHHRFMSARLESGEQRISRIPRPVVVKIRKNLSEDPVGHRKLSKEKKQFSERMFLRSWYTQEAFMSAENQDFTPQEGFKYISALMSLGEIKLGGEPFYVSFFDTSAMDRRRASLVTRIAADVVGDAAALSHLTRGDSEGFSRMFPDVVMIMIDIVGSTAKIKDQPVQDIFRDLNLLFGEFDTIVARYPEAVKVKTTGDGYILGVGLTEPKGTPSLEKRTNSAVNLARELSVAAQRYTLCGHPVIVRIGAHLGPVMGGILGTTKKVFDVLGSTVSVAARMESTGTPGKVQISEELWTALSGDEKEKFERRTSSLIKSTEYSGGTYISK